MCLTSLRIMGDWLWLAAPPGALADDGLQAAGRYALPSRAIPAAAGK
jgi:hypothetical protein